MGSGLAESAVRPAPVSKVELLRRFLQAYWLRPENALWMTLRSRALSKCAWESPSIDICCGDGVFSFLHAGGRFDPAFDVFTAVDQLEQVRDQHADMFDHYDAGYSPGIQSPPAYAIDVGVDLKQALLAKARPLGLYTRFLLHDSNNALPFETRCFQTVYCNAAYWINRIDRFLGELNRITESTGRIILQVKLDSLRRYTLEDHRSVLGDRFLQIIGRGRLDCWPTLASRQVWEQRFAAASLRVEAMTPFVTRTHAQIWDVGLRPIAPLLVKMANSLTPATRASIKSEWVDLLCDLLRPVCNPNLDLFPGPNEPAEVQYVLTPR